MNRKERETLKSMAIQRYINYYDVFVLITFNILYGMLILHNEALIWEMYTFHVFMAPYLIPSVVGGAFIASGLMVGLGKRFGTNILFRLGLSVGVFLWTIYGITFLFAAPPNGVWFFSLYMVGLCVKVAFKQ